MKHRKSNIYISAFCVAAGISSCSTDATMPRAAGETRSVDMQITVSKSTDASRTVIAENDGDLDCLWTAGDRIVVSSTDGTKLGILSLTSGAGESQAVFEGKIEVTEEEGTSTFNFFYFGTETDPESIGSTVMLNYSSQEGTLASLSANDFFSASSNVSIAYGSATAESVVLKRATAFGRFNLQFEGADWSGETVTVSGSGLTNILNVGLDGSITTDNAENATITVANPEADLWLTILPGETDLTFTTTIGEKLYTATLPSRKWTAGEYVRMANADGTISGIPVEMTTEPDPITDPGDAVGPVFEVKDKKFRFTKANLAYNVNEKRGICSTSNGRSSARRAGHTPTAHTSAPRRATSTSSASAAPVCTSPTTTTVCRPRHSSKRTSTLRNISSRRPFMQDSPSMEHHRDIIIRHKMKPAIRAIPAAILNMAFRR